MNKRALNETQKNLQEAIQKKIQYLIRSTTTTTTTKKKKQETDEIFEIDDIMLIDMDRSATSTIKAAAFRLPKNSSSYNELTDAEKDTLNLVTSIFVDHYN